GTSGPCGQVEAGKNSAPDMDFRGHPRKTQQGSAALRGSPFNMCVEVATPNLYAVSQRNCRQAPDTRMTDMGRRSGCSSSNDDVESPALLGLRSMRGTTIELLWSHGIVCPLVRRSSRCTWGF